MSVGNVHLTEREKLELARGSLEHGSAVDHLEECAVCAAAVEQLSAEEERRVYAEARDDAPPDWLRDAALKSLDELEPRGSAGPESNAPISGSWTIRPAANEKAARNERTARNEGGPSRFVGPGALAGAGLVAFAAAAVLYLKSSGGGGPYSGERSGGVSAELFCSEKGTALVELGATDAACARGAQLVVRAVPAPDNRLPYLTVVACEGARCKSISRSRFNGPGDLTAAGPLMGPGERVDVILIWSDRELSDELLSESAKSRSQDASVPSLALSPSWAQVGFAVRAVDGSKSR